MEREYAIVDNQGRFLTAPNETGSARYISLLTKKEAKMQILLYYRYKNYVIRKMKV